MSTDIREALPERDIDKPAERQGVFRKFKVHRTDNSDAPGGKHEGCEYFVLDVDHDPCARAALIAYAAAVEPTHPILAADMRRRYELTEPPAVAAESVEASCETEDQGFAVDAILQFVPELLIRDDGRIVLTPAQIEVALRRCGWRPPGEAVIDIQHAYRQMKAAQGEGEKE